MHEDDGLEDPQGSPDMPDSSGEQWAGADGEPGWADELSSQGVGPAALLTGTFVVGLVTSVLFVLAWGAFTDDDTEDIRSDTSSLVSGRESPDPGPSGAGAADTDTDISAHDHPPATRLSRCVRAARNLQASVEAARPALDQWAVHVGAMNKLVVGEITLQQATDFWERTRVGAQRRVADFRDAMSTLRRRGVDCPSPELLAPGARALPGCARHVEATAHVLRTATTSIDTWDTHVRDMDMLRLGELSPEDATRMWLSMWQQGVRDLDTYRSVAREARRRDGCGLVGAAR